MQRMTASEYRRAVGLDPQGPPALPAGGAAPVPVPDELLSQLAGNLPPASEAEVEGEVWLALRERKALRPQDTPALLRGALVMLWTTHRAQPKGITPGAPDLWLCRVGWWAWRGIELKARSPRGRCAGRPSPEQQVLIDAGVVLAAWSAPQVLYLVERWDTEAGYRSAS